MSTGDQSLGLDAQREALSRWCSANGTALAAVHVDEGVSGGAALEDRPGLLAALDDVRTRGAGVLLVAKRDRLARDVVIAAMVERLAERQGAHLLAADGAGNGLGPEAGLMRHLLAAFAEYERQIIRTRTRAALAVKRTRGERVGALPYGRHLSADGVHLVEDEAEGRVVEIVTAAKAEGLPLRAIAARLDAAGHVPRGGGRWHPQTVANIARAAPVAA